MVFTLFLRQAYRVFLNNNLDLSQTIEILDLKSPVLSNYTSENTFIKPTFNYNNSHVLIGTSCLAISAG